MKKRKFWLVTLLCLLTAALCVSCGEATEQKKGKLVLTDWTDSAETVVLGDCYETAGVVAKDADGNEYPVIVKVVRIASGKEVPLIGGAFDIVEIGGYEIIYTATSETAEATKKVTITVKDENPPVIIATGTNIAEAGVKYLYPTLNISDDSGVVSSYKVEVLNEAGEKVAFDDAGFVPPEIGYYTLKISATDGANNSSEDTFELYARKSSTQNEVDSFDDEGVPLVAYTKEGKTKIPATLAAFKKSSVSDGSAMFPSVSDAFTGVYITPRMTSEKAAEAGVNAYLSVWLYLADAKKDEREVSYGNATTDVPTNVWTELKITSNEVGDYTRFLNNLSLGQRALFSVENGGNDYFIFVDDVYLVQTAPELSGLKEAYAVGEAVTFSAPQSATVDVTYGEAAIAVESGFVPTCSGEYTLTVTAADNAVKTYTFTVGSLNLSMASDAWYTIGEENPLPAVTLKDGKTETVGEAAYWLFNPVTGEKTEVLGDTIVPEEDTFFVYAESTVGAVKAAAFKFFSASKYDYNTWYSFDTEESATKSTQAKRAEWLEEHDGEEGVLKVTLGITDAETDNSVFIGNRTTWGAVFPKEHYADASYIKFRVKGEMREGLQCAISWTGENPWMSVNVGRVTSTEWTDLVIDFKIIYENFDNFSKYWLLWLNASKTAGYTGETANESFTLYIADISVIRKAPAEAGTIFGFDDQFWVSLGNNVSTEWLEEYDGETGVMRADVSTTDEGKAKEMNLQNPQIWQAPFEKEYYAKAVGKIKIRAKLVSENENLRMAFAWCAQNPWVAYPAFTINVTDGWVDYEIDFATFYEHFDNFMRSGFIWTNTTCTGATERVTGELYISRIWVEIDENAQPEEPETPENPEDPEEPETPEEKDEVGIKWDKNWL